jgi:hypothetical protein
MHHRALRRRCLQTAQAGDVVGGSHERGDLADLPPTDVADAPKTTNGFPPAELL